MKVCILGSVALPVPPPMQGGTERIAYFQAKGLASRGHTVTLVAARGSLRDPSYALVQIGGGDTVIGALHQQAQSSKLKAQSDQEGFVESSRNLRKEAVYLSHVAQWLLDHGKDFDVILNNMRAGEAFFLPLAKSLGVPFTTVMHLPMFPELAVLFATYHTPVITISNAQRREYPDLRYAGTVYNGIEINDFPFAASGGEYLLMMGSIAPHKNQKAGIAVANALGMRLVIAGKIGNPGYYENEIVPSIDGEKIRLIGEIGMEEKRKLYAGARALLFPVLWEEPFGLVMIEAMAVGTPVVAYGMGAVPEVVKDGMTGFIVTPEIGDVGGVGNQIIKKRGIEGLVEAVKRIGQIDRAACRRHVEEHFTVEKMIDALERILTTVCQK